MLVDGCLQKCKPEARAKFYGVAATPLKDLTNMETSHQSLKKHKLIRDGFKDRLMPNGITPYRDAFATVANESPATDTLNQDGVWQFICDSFTFTVASTGDPTLSDFKEAARFMGIAARSTVDVVIARGYRNHSGGLVLPRV